MKKQIPIKNYVILGIVAVLTILLTIYIVKWYKVNEQYQKNSTFLSDILSEVKEGDLEDYLIDNPTVLVYLVNAKEQYRNFEKELKEYILENNLAQNIVYINVTNASSELSKKLESYATEEFKNENYFSINPNILVFEEHQVIDVLFKEKKEPTVQDVHVLVEKYRD